MAAGKQCNIDRGRIPRLEDSDCPIAVRMPKYNCAATVAHRQQALLAQRSPWPGRGFPRTPGTFVHARTLTRYLAAGQGPWLAKPMPGENESTARPRRLGQKGVERTCERNERLHDVRVAGAVRTSARRTIDPVLNTRTAYRKQAMNCGFSGNPTNVDLQRSELLLLQVSKVGK